jgi:hypothetical protein
MTVARSQQHSARVGAGVTIPSFAILTDEPNELVAPYHNCIPVVLADVERWLNINSILDDLWPLGPDQFAVRAVSSAVNKVSEKSIDVGNHAALLRARVLAALRPRDVRDFAFFPPMAWLLSRVTMVCVAAKTA